MNQKKKKELIDKYAIKEVGGGTFGEGFFDALSFFDNKLERYLDSDVYYGFHSYLKRTQKK